MINSNIIKMGTVICVWKLIQSRNYFAYQYGPKYISIIPYLVQKKKGKVTQQVKSIALT